MKHAVYLVTFFFCITAVSQTQDSVFFNIVNKVQEAYKNKEYARAIPLYQKVLSLSEGKPWVWGVHYNLACCYAQIKDGANAFDQLALSVKMGNQDYRLMQNDSDLTFLRKTLPEKFKELVAMVKQAEQDSIRNGSPVAVVEYKNFDGPTDISAYVWDRYNHPLMDTLRSKYKLESIVAQGKTEFEKMKLLLNWVATRWVHNGNNTCKDQNALAILAAAEKGEGFACVDYGTVLTQCLNALGYPARSMGIMKYGVATGNGKGHRCTEVWSNQFDKWILLDGQNNAWWEVNGIPLNADECRALLVADKEQEMQFIGQHREVDYRALHGTWCSYFYHVWFPFDNQFWDSVKVAGDRSAEYLSPGVTPELFSGGWALNLKSVTDETVAYPCFNQTSIRLKCSRTTLSDTVQVILGHTMPYFQRFLVRLNETDWEERQSSFSWVLAKGENTIEAKAVNLAGVEGRVSRIVLRNNIPEHP